MLYLVTVRVAGFKKKITNPNKASSFTNLFKFFSVFTFSDMIKKKHTGMKVTGLSL